MYRKVKSAAKRIARWSLSAARAELKALRREPGLLIAFLALDRNESSGLLRIKHVAEGLEQRGWNTVILYGNLSNAHRASLLRRLRPDLVVVKGARHDFHRRELLSSHAYVVDLDDADFLDPHLSDVMADLASGASGFIAGSRFIADWARTYCDTVEIVWTGSPVSGLPTPSQADRDDVIAWAQSRPQNYRAEMAFLGDVLERVLERRAHVRLRLYGRAPQDKLDVLAPLQKPGVEIEWLGWLDYDDFLASLRQTAVGLCPLILENPYSRGKSFGKILGYLEAHVPVICSDAADHSVFFGPHTGIVSDDPEVWATAIVDLLDHPDRRQKMANSAFDDFMGSLHINAAVEKTEKFLQTILSSASPHHA